MQGVAASHHDSAPMQPPGTSFGNRFRQMTRSFTRRRPSCVRTCWNRTEPESYRISSESRSHPGQRLFTRLLRGFGARSRIFAVQRSLSAAGPGRPAEFPNRVSQSLRITSAHHCSDTLMNHSADRCLPPSCMCAARNIESTGARPAGDQRSLTRLFQGPRRSNRLRHPPATGHNATGSVCVLQEPACGGQRGERPAGAVRLAGPGLAGPRQV